MKGAMTARAKTQAKKVVGELRWFEKRWGTQRFEAALLGAWWNPQVGGWVGVGVGVGGRSSSQEWSR